jgi:hypothetical protein
MSLKVPAPQPNWSVAYQIRVNQALESNDLSNRKKGADIELLADRLILRSPDGARWAITVDNAGVVGATAL